jgi:hypothetical protein
MTRLKLQPKTKLQLKHKILRVGGASVATAFLILLGLEYKKEKTFTDFSPETNSATKVHYNWDSDANLAAVGPNALDISSQAYVSSPSSLESGLNPGKLSKDINLKLPKEILDVEGVDISIDFQRDETDGFFVLRGEEFSFGMIRGKLGVRYTVSIKGKGKKRISANNIYKIPDDDIFRNYRFTYDQKIGIGMLYVNNEEVWQSKATPNAVLSWRKSSPVWIGRGMNGGGKNKPVLDNLVINEIK